MSTGSDHRPNFLVVMVDDMGYSDCQPFGGEIATPRLQELAEAGVRFRGFHTSSLCAPTRAMLLSGCDNHQAGLGVMQPLHAMNQYMQPGYEGYLNHSVPTMAELLRDAGYHTYLAGKWHVGITDDTRPAARRHFLVDAESITVGVLAMLARGGEVPQDRVVEAARKYQIHDVMAAGPQTSDSGVA